MRPRASPPARSTRRPKVHRSTVALPNRSIRGTVPCKYGQRELGCTCPRRASKAPPSALQGPRRPLQRLRNHELAPNTTRRAATGYRQRHRSNGCVTCLDNSTTPRDLDLRMRNGRARWPVVWTDHAGRDHDRVDANRHTLTGQLGEDEVHIRQSRRVVGEELEELTRRRMTSPNSGSLVQAPSADKRSGRRWAASATVVTVACSRVRALNRRRNRGPGHRAVGCLRGPCRSTPTGPAPWRR